MQGLEWLGWTGQAGKQVRKGCTRFGLLHVAVKVTALLKTADAVFRRDFLLRTV